jgi:hypothetical protein
MLVQILWNQSNPYVAFDSRSEAAGDVHSAMQVRACVRRQLGSIDDLPNTALANK